MRGRSVATENGQIMSVPKSMHANSRVSSVYRAAKSAQFMGFGSLVIVILSVSSAMGSGAIISSAPYHGLVSVNGTKNVSGCGHMKVLHPLSFQLKYGKAVAATVGSAPTCKVASKLSALDTAGYYGTMLVAIPIKGMTSGTTHVTANLSWGITTTLNTSDGFAAKASAPCLNPLYTFDDHSASYEWSYNSTIGAYYNYNTTNIQLSNHVRSVTSYGTAPVPRPFVRNSTNAFDVEHEYGGYRTCTAMSSISLTVSAALLDKFNGSEFPQSGNTVADFYGQVFSAQVEIINTTNWDCYSARIWDGPNNLSSNSPLRCVSFNATTRAFVSALPVLHRTHSYANNSQSWTGSYIHKGAFWWNSSAPGAVFKPSHGYELQLMFILSTAATNSWPLGSSSWAFNMLSGSYGLVLRNIAVG